MNLFNLKNLWFINYPATAGFATTKWQLRESIPAWVLIFHIPQRKNQKKCGLVQHFVGVVASNA